VPVGSSIFMIVVGAILRYAVTWRIHGVNLPALGLILAIAGIVTLVLRLIWLFNPGLVRPEAADARPPAEPSAALTGWPAGSMVSSTKAPSRTPPPPSAALPGGAEGWPPRGYPE
jgi:hypothetical protein